MASMLKRMGMVMKFISILIYNLNLISFFIENLMALIASIDSFPRNMEFARNGSVSLSNRVILFKKVIVNFHS